MSRHKHYDCIVAWAAGAKIELKRADNTWIHVDNPDWNISLEYRIKKEPANPNNRITQMVFSQNRK